MLTERCGGRVPVIGYYVLRNLLANLLHLKLNLIVESLLKKEGVWISPENPARLADCTKIIALEDAKRKKDRKPVILLSDSACFLSSSQKWIGEGKSFSPRRPFKRTSR